MDLVDAFEREARAARERAGTLEHDEQVAADADGRVGAHPDVIPVALSSREYVERMLLQSHDWFLDAEVLIKAKRLGLEVFEQIEDARERYMPRLTFEMLRMPAPDPSVSRAQIQLPLRPVSRAS